jgi:hypothetical protein
MDEGGFVDEACLSLKRLCGGGAPSLGTLEDMLRKFPDTGISLYGGPFSAEGNLVCGGGDSYTGDFDRWKEASSGGASLCKGLHKGTFREGFFTGEPEI